MRLVQVGQPAARANRPLATWAAGSMARPFRNPFPASHSAAYPAKWLAGSWREINKSSGPSEFLTLNQLRHDGSALRPQTNDRAPRRLERLRPLRMRRPLGLTERARHSPIVLVLYWLGVEEPAGLIRLS